MYAAAGHIGVKQDQDRSAAMSSDQYLLVLLCDGIGEFKGSGRVAELVVRAIEEEKPESRDGMMAAIRTVQEDIKREGIEGGTTLICAYRNHAWPDGEVVIQHLGNGAVMHLAGDFSDPGPGQFPYRYRHVVLPHVDPQGVLVRHVSHRSMAPELDLSETRLRLNSPQGDILLFVTDGIATLEEEMIVRNEEGSFWRYEFGALQLLLERLGRFMQEPQEHEGFSKRLGEFVHDALARMKDDGLLEDDASLGIIVTDAVLQYHRKRPKQ